MPYSLPSDTRYILYEETDLAQLKQKPCHFKVSIRPTTGIKPLYTTIATVTMNLIVSAAIVLLNPYTRVRDKDCVKNRVKRAKIVRFTLC